MFGCIQSPGGRLGPCLALHGSLKPCQNIQGWLVTRVEALDVMRYVNQTLGAAGSVASDSLLCVNVALTLSQYIILSDCFFSRPKFGHLPVPILDFPFISSERRGRTLLIIISNTKSEDSAIRPLPHTLTNACCWLVLL